MFFVLMIILTHLNQTLGFQHHVFKRSVVSNNHLQVKGAEYIFACMKENKCIHVIDFEIQENVTSTCNDQNILISFLYMNELNITQKLAGYLTQETGAPMMGKQHTIDDCKIIKK